MVKRGQSISHIEATSHQQIFSTYRAETTNHHFIRKKNLKNTKLLIYAFKCDFILYLFF